MVMESVLSKINKRALVASLVTTIILMSFCYLITNLGFSISSEGAWVVKTNKTIKNFYFNPLHIIMLLLNIINYKSISLN